jgi:hypothetical protein
MRRARPILGLLVLSVVLLLSDAHADRTEFKIIVHPDNPAASISSDVLRTAYLKRSAEWPDGSNMRVLDLSSRYPARAAFGARVLKKTPAQLRSYWNQRVFSGKGTPPPQVDSVEDAVEYVLHQRTAVAYVPADTDPGRAKVIAIR